MQINLKDHIVISDTDIKYSGGGYTSKHIGHCKDCGIELRGYAHRCKPCRDIHLKKYSKDRYWADVKASKFYNQKPTS